MSDATKTPATWLGAELDWHAVRRDAVLAGVFAALNVFSGTFDWTLIPLGLLFGAGIGAILHVMPAEPRPTDSARGRIIIRGLSGLVGGAWTAGAVAVLASGALVDDGIAYPMLGDLWQELLVGAITGAAWYTIWGLYETRPSAPRSQPSIPGPSAG